MAQALTAFVIFMVVAGGIIISLNRRTRAKMQETALEGELAAKPETPKPRNLSKRQERIVSTLEPTKELPSMEQLVAEEAAETGVNDIAGGAGLDVSLKLRVYWRDEVVRNGCTDGVLEFRIDEDVEPAAAETEDVRLVCVRNGVDQPRPAAADDQPAQKQTASTLDESVPNGGDGNTDVAGNFEAGLDVD
ncbi:MAG: hypothetical protein HKN91_10120 [Acidimicrobiia bacterium]|nr:hypothetical protein [Acidimicrobiia bacterium]